jgi:hypothetical protein
VKQAHTRSFKYTHTLLYKKAPCISVSGDEIVSLGRYETGLDKTVFITHKHYSTIELHACTLVDDAQIELV